MTTVTDINSLLGTTAGAAGSSAKDINDRFLKLLVAQMKNQDPLNPLDNAQVTTQMAQINTVTGINNLTDTVAKLLEQFTGMQTLQAANLTGRQVLVDGNRMTVDAAGVSGAALQLPGDATSVKVEIRDANGLLVRTMDLGALRGGLQQFAWDGKNDAGVQVATGRYSFSVAAKAGGTEFAADTLMSGRVEGIRNQSGELQLVLKGIGAVAYGDIKQIL